MRLVRHLMALCAALVLAGCNISFDVPVESETTVRGGGLFAGLLGNAFGDFANLDLSSSQEFRNQGVGKNDVKSVQLTELTLSIVEPASGNFDFISRISFFVEAEGLEKKRVAVADPVAKGLTRIELSLDDVELAPYITAPSMSLTTDANARAPEQDTKIQAKAVFSVVPKIL